MMPAFHVEYNSESVKGLVFERGAYAYILVSSPPLTHQRGLYMSHEQEYSHTQWMRRSDFLDELH